MAIHKWLSLLETVRRAAASFGYPQLKKEQEQAIFYFVMLPQSSWYHHWSFWWRTKVTTFTVKGIHTVYVSDREDYTGATRQSMRKGEHQVVYVSPEALFSTLEMRTMLSTQLYRANLVGSIVRWSPLC